MAENERPPFGIPEFAGMSKPDARRVWRKCWRRSFGQRLFFLSQAINGASIAGGCALGAILAVRLGGRYSLLVFALCFFPTWAVGMAISRRIDTALMRKLIRRELGLSCGNCDYDLTGNVSGICPECGTPIPASSTTSKDQASRQSP
jgi:hypothetical protein